MSTYRVRYIPIADGDQIELGATAPQTTSFYSRKTPHLILGFKPGPGPRAAGWLVVLVDDSAKGRGNAQPRKLRRSSAEKDRRLRAVS